MGYRTILAAASGGTASDGVVELACRLASRFDAHVEGFHVGLDTREVILTAAHGFGMPLPGEWIDQLEAESAAIATKTKAAFDAAVERHALTITTTPGNAAASAAWREEAGYAPVLVARHARFFDLVVLGRSDRVIDRPHSDAVEEVLLHAGRPVLLAPAVPPPVFGETVALGWNGSPEAVRVLAAALPILRAARAAHVIAVGDRDGEDIASAVEHLAWHGITATRRTPIPIPGVGAGEQLLAEARDAGADLLVMGAYGHKTWREMLFGGATVDVVGTSLLPVLLSH